LEKKSIKNNVHYVYDDIEEFKIDHPNNVVEPDWRKANEGDWVWSDDARIIQLLKVSKSVNHPSDSKNYKYANGWVRTVVGSFVNRHNVKMDTDFSSHPNRYTFSKTINNTGSRVRERKNITRKEKEFVTNIVVGMKAVDAYKKAYNEMSQNNAQKKATILLKQERVMSEIEKSVLDIAKNLGIDHQYVLSNLKNLADHSEDDNIILQSTKELGKIVGTSGNTIKQKEVGLLGVFQGFSQDEIEGATRGQKQITSKVEVK
tara:strand:+ start:2040 stop:2819 length:780 start_codon:yes stop_codon:yes gene_type:complete